MSYEHAIHHPIPIPRSTCKAHMYAEGFGTWQAEPGAVKKAVLIAIESGYRLLDCARIYCNQHEVGEALKYAFENKLVERKDLFIVSKVWNTEHAPEDAIKSTHQSIKDLQCEYLDLLLIHWPVAFKKLYEGYTSIEHQHLFPNEPNGAAKVVSIPQIDTWKAIETLVDDGKVKDIGLSNFTIEEIEDITKQCRIFPSVLQIECHAALPQNELRAFCEKNGMVIMGYCPMAIGTANPNVSLINDPKIKEIAKKQYGEDGKAAQLLLQWSNQMGNIVLTKSVTEKRIKENARVPYRGLSNETMKAIAEFSFEAMKKGCTRVCNPDFFSITPATLFFKD